MQEIDKTLKDDYYLQATVKLALEAEMIGNLPIGAVIVLNDKIISEGKNSIYVPIYQPDRHAEIEALKSIPKNFLFHSKDMTCYTTLEPCIMCMATLIIYGVGRVVFGAVDPMGGGKGLLEHLPEYYRSNLLILDGPALPEICDQLYIRAKNLFINYRKSQFG